MKVIHYLCSSVVKPVQFVAGNFDNISLWANVWNFVVTAMGNNEQVLRTQLAGVVHVPWGERPVIMVNYCQWANFHTHF